MTAATAESPNFTASIDREGWAVTAPVVPQLAVDRLCDALVPFAREDEPRETGRNLFDAAPSIRELALSPAVRSVAESVLGPACFAVRAVYFDKALAANWRGIWQQDLTIPVRSRERVLSFGPWSEKDGVQNVQPPVEILERMLMVRVHLDDCGPENGPLRVLPGSHRVGKLSPAGIAGFRRGSTAVECLAERGAILAYRPLIIHASTPVISPAQRRVVHLEFAVDELPEPLAWYSRVA
jgi:hypothetical protein